MLRVYVSTCTEARIYATCMDAPRLVKRCNQKCVGGRDCSDVSGLDVRLMPAVPDGIRWLAPHQRREPCARVAYQASANHGLTVLPSLFDRPSNRFSGELTGVLLFLNSGLRCRSHCGGRTLRVEVPLVRQECPNDSRILVREGNGRHVDVASPAQCLKPTAHRAFEFASVDHRTNPVDKQRTQMHVTAFADAEQDILASTGALPRHQAKPRCQLATAGKATCIAHRRYQCTGGKRANPGNFSQPAAQVTVPVPRLNLCANFIRLAIEFFEIFQQSLDQHTECPGSGLVAPSMFRYLGVPPGQTRQAIHGSG